MDPEQKSIKEESGIAYKIPISTKNGSFWQQDWY